jgi:hypothetical protein
VLVLSEELVDEEPAEVAPGWEVLMLVVEPPTVVATAAPVDVVFLTVVVDLAAVVAVDLTVVAVAGLAVVVVAGFAVVVVVGGLQWHPGAQA